MQPLSCTHLWSSRTGFLTCSVPNRLLTISSEDELGGNESELKHLRLRLRAVEVMCYEYVPADADPELLESIENWKSDWATLKKKMTGKRRERNPHAEVNSALSTPSASVLLENPRPHRSRPLAND